MWIGCAVWTCTETRLIKACVRVPGEGRKRQATIATLGSKTGDLLALGDWLEQWQVTQVAMESTGEYWKPV